MYRKLWERRKLWEYTLRDFNCSNYLSIDGDSGFTESRLDTVLKCTWRRELAEDMLKHT